MAGEKCQRKGCAGVIVDGFCSDCGRPPLGVSALAQAAAHQAQGPSTGVGSVRAGTGSSPSGRTSTSGSGRSSRSGSLGSRRRGLGAGLVDLQPLPAIDPMTLVMADPTVPPDKRFCGSCQKRVNLVKGFCPSCGQAYCFEATLKPGDMVAGQYEAKGALAFGGLGWIYLAFDTVLQRWVVLKGLLNTRDEASAQAALQEKRFLAEVKHPNIVGVYNFVNHGSEGYIVMEFVGGKTLKTMRRERGPLPVLEACAYIHRILLAFGYLHRAGMVYCDFKPDNCMVEAEDVKLIDMGGVRRIDDMEGYVYGTKGYSAPEAGEDPSFSSDLYTVGRTLAILVTDFKLQGEYQYALPSPAAAPVFAQHPSLYSFLLKSTQQDRDWRFQTAEEMAEQLLGVMREIASEGGQPDPQESAIFNKDRLEMQKGHMDVASLDAAVESRPTIKVDTLDPAANYILSTGAGVDSQRLASLYRTALPNYPDSLELPLRLADALIANGDYSEAEEKLAIVDLKDPFDWRTWWYRGVSLLRRKQAHEAAGLFEKINHEAPGELAPKLAQAVALEMAGDPAKASALYDIVSRTDPGYTSAIFGLGRTLLAIGDRDGAVSAYDRAPQSSSLHAEAQMERARAFVLCKACTPGEHELIQASTTIESLTMDSLAIHQLCVDVLQVALDRLESKGVNPSASSKVLGCDMLSGSLRTGMEKHLRACARFAKSPHERISWIDRANQVRPWTVV